MLDIVSIYSGLSVVFIGCGSGDPQIRSREDENDRTGQLKSISVSGDPQIRSRRSEDENGRTGLSQLKSISVSASRQVSTSEKDQF